MQKMNVNQFNLSASLWLLLLASTLFVMACNDPEEPIVLETGTMIDQEGNSYSTIKIGNQWWMAEDLKTTSFRSGVLIDKIGTDDQQWASTNSAAYTTYGNSTETPGFLYNFAVVNGEEEIAPEGWHVPTDEEWKELESFLGMSNSDLEEINWRGTTEGDKLKIEGTEGWLFYEGIWGTNESGFSAYGGGSRFYEGPYGIPGLKGSGFWWTSSSNQGHGWYRYLDYKKSGIFRYYGHPNYGFSIRCVKDN